MSETRSSRTRHQAYAREMRALRRLADAIGRDVERAAHSATRTLADALARRLRSPHAAGAVVKERLAVARTRLVPPDPARALEALAPHVAPQGLRDRPLRPFDDPPTLPDFLLETGAARALATYGLESEALREVLADDVAFTVVDVLRDERRGRAGACRTLALAPEADALDAMLRRLRRTVRASIPAWFARAVEEAARGAHGRTVRWVRVCRTALPSPGGLSARGTRRPELRLRCIDLPAAEVPARHRAAYRTALEWLAKALADERVDLDLPRGVRFRAAFLPAGAIADCIDLARQAARILWAEGAEAAAAALARDAIALEGALHRSPRRQAPKTALERIAARHGLAVPPRRAVALPTLSGAGWCRKEAAPDTDVAGFRHTEGGFELVLGPALVGRIRRAFRSRAG